MGKRKSDRNDSVNYRNVHRHNRKRVRILSAFIALVILVGAFVALSVTVLFKTKEIVVSGDSEYDNAAIVSASGIRLQDNLFLQDRETAAAKIEKELPYLVNVRIKIRLPDTLVIEVEEAEVQVAIHQHDGYLLINEQDKALEKVSELPEGIIPVENLKVESAVLGETVVYEKAETRGLFDELLAAIDTSGIRPITEIDLENLYSIRVHYEDRFWIKLGTVGKLADKLSLVKYVIQNELANKRTGTLDISGDSSQVVFRADYDSIGVIIEPNRESAEEKGE